VDASVGPRTPLIGQLRSHTPGSVEATYGVRSVCRLLQAVIAISFPLPMWPVTAICLHLAALSTRLVPAGINRTSEIDQVATLWDNKRAHAARSDEVLKCGELLTRLRRICRNMRSIHDVCSAADLVEKNCRMRIVALDRGSDQDKRPLAQVSTVLGPSTTYRENAATAPLRLGGSSGSPCHT